MAMAIFSCSKHYISFTLFTNLKLSRSYSSSYTCSSTAQYNPITIIENCYHLKTERDELPYDREKFEPLEREEGSWSSGVLRRRKKRRKKIRGKLEECDEYHMDLPVMQREPEESASKSRFTDWDFDEDVTYAWYVQCAAERRPP